jgi:hypothetical protein
VAWFVLLIASVELKGFLFTASPTGVDLDRNIVLAHAVTVETRVLGLIGLFYKWTHMSSLGSGREIQQGKCN